MKILFTAQATEIGGRNVHSEAADKSVAGDLSIPKEMGGPGKPGTTTPEKLFATGYAACFGNTLDYVARSRKIDVANAAITAKIGIGQRDGGGFSLSVALEAYLPGHAQATAEALAAEAHTICRYSNAIRGNVEVALTARV